MDETLLGKELDRAGAFSSVSQASHGNSQSQLVHGDSPDKNSDEGGIFMTNLPQIEAVDQTDSIATMLGLYGQLTSILEKIDTHYKSQLLNHEKDFKKAYGT